MLLAGPGVTLLGAAVGDGPIQPLGAEDLLVDGLPAAGSDLRLRLRAADRGTLTLLDLTPGFPDLPALAVPPRPPRSVSPPAPDWARGDPTLVRRTIQLPP